MYLDAMIDTNQKYTDYFILPDLNRLDEAPIKSLRLLQAMAGFQ
jgi:hypothetical protein